MKGRRRGRYRCRESGKVKFSSYLAAHARAMSLRAEGRAMHAYRCRHCRKWHIGHSASERLAERIAEEQRRVAVETSPVEGENES